MRWFAPLLAALLSLGAIASKNAGPYQAMMYWYVRQLEIEAYGAGSSKITIAPNCQGACTFDDFLNHIQQAGKSTNLNPTNLPNDFDIETTWTTMKNGGYNHLPDNSRLFRNWGSKTSNFRTVMAELELSTDAARVELSGRGVDVNNHPNGNKIKAATEGMLNARKLEYGDALTTLFKSVASQKGVKNVPTTTKVRGRFNIPEVDFNALVGRTGLSPANKAWIQDFLLDYSSGALKNKLTDKQLIKKAKTGPGHFNAMTAGKNYKAVAEKHLC
ncbi:hypothetical protein NQ176_g3473 [Zarea fungicola]|uniref:Uncharacterized protein n=1 Tax=Zarea fungicola TaxID=93591 RepID=A0ACC1NIG3_9HYPO|nr:hypothetical protein NQ176_g3473 [Lecanicillium fungicola]